MDDLRLREALRPLAESISTRTQLESERMFKEGFKDDGTLERRVMGDVITLDRLDWIVAPGAPAGLQTARYFIPEDSRLVRLALIATSNASGTFSADVLVNGAARSGGSICAGSDRSSGVFSIDLPGGSVVSVQTKNSIAQGVTVSVFYRPMEE